MKASPNLCSKPEEENDNSKYNSNGSPFSNQSLKSSNESVNKAMSNIQMHMLIKINK